MLSDVIWPSPSHTNSERREQKNKTLQIKCQELVLTTQPHQYERKLNISCNILLKLVLNHHKQTFLSVTHIFEANKRVLEARKLSQIQITSEGFEEYIFFLNY